MVSLKRKKLTVVLFIFCLLITVMVISLFHKTKIASPSEIIVEVSKESFVEMPEHKVIEYYQNNKENLNAISDYLLKNQRLFMTSPVIINLNNNDVDKISDMSIKEKTKDMLDNGPITQIMFSDGNFNDVHFQVKNEYGVYEQGIRYVNDPEVISSDRTKYNYVKEYKDLGHGWYYYLYYYNKIKDSDIYRESIWDKLRDTEKKTLNHDWKKAIVSLEDWNNVPNKIIQRDLEFVVSVYFSTNIDGILGPIIFYLDPSTKEIVGTNVRY